MKSVEERRRYPRFEAPLSAEFKTARSVGDYALGMVRDFSRNGCRLIAKGIDANRNTPVEIKLQMPDQDCFVSIWGDVLWVKDIEGSAQAGVEFKSIDPGVKWEVLEYAYDRWRQKQRQAV
jgi:c-di-GMP-binding flagellar brake protein YcgR